MSESNINITKLKGERTLSVLVRRRFFMMFQLLREL